MKNEYVVKKESFFRNYGDLLPENYKAWYKFIEPDTTLSGFTDKVLYYTHYKTGLIRKLTRFLRQITKVLYEPRFGQKAQTENKKRLHNNNISPIEDKRKLPELKNKRQNG
ncbi:hypothetical protein DWX23_03740 [Parabacteroides sp. AF18-52]|jgi:hypothetical protein|uniref:hypothetical protein n=1 Tax=Parabacteroides TaxID=375288 RepID=UPI000EFF2E7D|nr:hypothetical protein [Parabacteroides sp. AF18-52]RHR43612.1 hypothetical protein DWX23_03740 [Parabacteroides sp. AF18-52]